MKKILLFIGIIFISASASFAQKSIGLRLGTYGILYQLLTSEFSLMNNEITYQQPIDNDRLEIDFGMFGGFNFENKDYNKFVLSLTGVYQYKFATIKDFSCYAGPAASIGLYFLEEDKDFEGATLGIGGQAGVEDSLSSKGLPFLFSLDTRPMINLLSARKLKGFDIGIYLSVRYLF